jgi:hypothetical protein
MGRHQWYVKHERCKKNRTPLDNGSEDERMEVAVYFPVWAENETCQKQYLTIRCNPSSVSWSYDCSDCALLVDDSSVQARAKRIMVRVLVLRNKDMSCITLRCTLMSPIHVLSVVLYHVSTLGA